MAIVGEVCQSGTLSTLTGSTLANVCITASGEAGDFIVPFGEAAGILGGYHTPRASNISRDPNEKYYESRTAGQGLRIERRRPSQTEDRTCQRKLPLRHDSRPLHDRRLN
jgi:hypothetical protein